MFFKAYPKAIPYLFLTEMWERFSYYGITALLILYMTKTFSVSTEQIYAIYGAYGALVYMTPLAGGRLADKYLGSYNAVIIGALLIAAGHFVVAWPGQNQFHLFYLGLAIIIVGTGLFIPNINAIVGHLYRVDDPARTNGFTLAYMGRNVGTILAPIVAAWVAARYDWRWAFIVAGVGMLLGLWIFLKGRDHYNHKSFFAAVPFHTWMAVMAVLALLIFASLLTLEKNEWAGPLLTLTVVGITVVILRMTLKEEPKVRRQIYAAIILTVFYVVFMILLQQSGGALNLFTDTFVDRTYFGTTLATGMFQSVEPLALVLLTPFYNAFWNYLARNNKYMSDALKFVWALLLMSSSFVLMAVAMSFTHDNGLISMHWLNMTYVLQAAGELFIGPIGLAMVSRLIPKPMLGLYMGFWVLASAVANFVAAKIGAYITPELGVSQQAILAYQQAFIRLSVLGLGCAFLLWLLSPHLKRLLSEVK